MTWLHHGNEHRIPPLGGDVAVGRSTGVGRRRGSATGVEGLGGDGARVGTACTLGFPER